jgi:UDP-3-O-acyl-N-acetylglucosamine deacetylase
LSSQNSWQRQSTHVEGIGLLRGTYWRAWAESTAEEKGIGWYVYPEGISGASAPYWHFQATHTNVIHTENGVTLQDTQATGKTLSIVEHQLSSHAQLGLSSGVRWHLVPIHPDGTPRHLEPHDTFAELPLLDGSATVWTHYLQSHPSFSHTLPAQAAWQYHWHIPSASLLGSEGFLLGGANRFIHILPHAMAHAMEGTSTPLKVCYHMPAMAHHPALHMPEGYVWEAPSQKAQEATTELLEILNITTSEINTARTFGFMEDLETLQARGLAKGVREDNTLGLYRTPPQPNIHTLQALRHPHEPLAHKVLDLLGDLMLLGEGHQPTQLPLTLVCHNAGHGLHVALVKQLTIWLEEGVLRRNAVQEEPASGC